MSNTADKAIVELELLEKYIPDSVVIGFKSELIALVDKFGNSGQSGGSAPYVANAIANAVKKLCLQEPLAPVMNTPEEWYLPCQNSLECIQLYQNNRCSALFKKGIDGVPYYLDAIVWQGEDEYDSFTGTVETYASVNYVKSFPWIPKTFRIDVYKEQLPEDWNEEPFIEGSEIYNIDEFERTGVKNWHKNNYRYHIKDTNQLGEVFEYYDDFNFINKINE